VNKFSLINNKMNYNNQLYIDFEENLDLTYFPDSVFAINSLKELIQNKRLNESFIEIKTPTIVEHKLWKETGHWNCFSENILVFEGSNKNKKFTLKPMNCPGAALFVSNGKFDQNILKIFEIGNVFRNEKRGALSPFKRMISFHQDDLHIFIKNLESSKFIIADLVEDWKEFFGKILNWKYKIVLSTKPQDSLGSDKDWELSEKILSEVLLKKNLPIELDREEGAFYGPKLDLMIDVNEKWVQLSTVQLDFFLTKNLKVENYNFTIHSALFGSIERFFGVLLDKEGQIPSWLSNKEMVVLSIGCSNKYLNEVKDVLDLLKIKTIILENPNYNKVLKEFKYNYVFFLGWEEEQEEVVSIRNKNTQEKVRLDEISSFFKNKLILEFFKK